MKKILFIVLLFAVACSKDEDPTKQQTINEPEPELSISRLSMFKEVLDYFYQLAKEHGRNDITDVRNSSTFIIRQVERSRFDIYTTTQVYSDGTSISESYPALSRSYKNNNKMIIELNDYYGEWIELQSKNKHFAGTFIIMKELSHLLLDKPYATKEWRDHYYRNLMYPAVNDNLITDPIDWEAEYKWIFNNKPLPIKEYKDITQIAPVDLFYYHAKEYGWDNLPDKSLISIRSLPFTKFTQGKCNYSGGTIHEISRSYIKDGKYIVEINEYYLQQGFSDYKFVIVLRELSHIILGKPYATERTRPRPNGSCCDIDNIMYPCLLTPYIDNEFGYDDLFKK